MGEIIGSATQGGFFSDGFASGLGIDGGVILTTGAASDAVGPNSSGAKSVNSGTGGDADLAAIAGISTMNANVLQFDFVSATGDLFFNYIFASEEYSEFVDSNFNDPFALFVDVQNIALAPDGNEVAINNVNCGNPAGAAGPNCAFFNDNTGGAFDIEYDGFTDVFTASILGLSAGNHTIKFAVADANDAGWDSAVFIQGSSFTSVDPMDPTPVSEPASLSLMLIGMTGLIGFSRRKNRKNA